LIFDNVTDENKLAPFYGPRCRFRFIVNPNLDSLANRMAWIRGCCRKWRHCYLLTYRDMIQLFTSGFASESTSKLESLDSRIRIWVRALSAWMDRSTESNLNPDSDSANRIRP